MTTTTMKVRRTPLAIVLGGALLLAAPARAADPAPFSERAGETYANADGHTGTLDNRQWWKRFGDAELDALVERGTDGSYDLAAAQARIEEADAVVRQNLSPLLPTASWDSSITAAPTDSLGFQFGGLPAGGPEPPALYYTASSALNVGIEIDLTGRNVLTHRAAQRDRQASLEDYDARAHALTVNIVRAYYDAVAAKAQLEVAERQVQTNESLLELTELRFETGQVGAVDVLQQRQQLASSRALVPKARVQQQAFEQQLAVLLGEAPGTPLPVADTLPTLPPAPTVGRPTDLLRSRPDLRAAQRRIESAELRHKSARRQYAPTLRLKGQAGGQMFILDDVRRQGFWNVGATLSVPLYTGGNTLARSRQVRAQVRGANHDLDARAMTAMREVEDALMREQQQRQVVEATEAQAQAAREAFEEGRRRYAEGVGEYLPVLTALGAVQRSELDVITARRDLFAARIGLHQALGDSK